jgi:hypothetical protein
MELVLKKIGTLKYTGKILDMFLTYSTKRRFEDENWT